MRQAGREVAREARRLIRNSAGGGRLYRGPGGSAGKYRGGYVRGQHVASAPGQAPASVTGTLARQIVVRPFKSGEGVAIRDTAFYARFLETGARGGGRFGPRSTRKGGRRKISMVRALLPRPFLTAALESRSGTLGPRLQQAVTSGIKLVRQK
ncbi:MAG: hypothetical protein KGL63_05935 [Betaproteobacteria bacterium]|nr:hypothetical protein [Betaproteobacteria bacterium]